jgi:hypothetical protein
MGQALIDGPGRADQDQDHPNADAGLDGKQYVATGHDQGGSTACRRAQTSQGATTAPPL